MAAHGHRRLVPRDQEARLTFRPQRVTDPPAAPKAGQRSDGNAAGGAKKLPATDQFAARAVIGDAQERGLAWNVGRLHAKGHESPLTEKLYR